MSYFDNAATTRPYPEVLEAMTIVGTQNYANRRFIRLAIKLDSL